MGLALKDGTGGRRNADEAIKWFRLAAEQGHAGACNDLGTCYATGAGVPANPALAVEWFKKAAAKHHPDALFNLGVAYHEGLGVPKDLTKAATCFIKSAQLGNATAMLDAGVAYAKGEGVPRDRAEAYEWFKKASTEGESGADSWLTYLREQGFGLPPVENGGGIVHGPNHVYAIQAPKGWVIDNAIWADQGIFAVFYQAGHSFQESPVVAYTMVQEPSSDGIEAHIKRDLDGTVEGLPTALVQRKDSLKTKDGREAIVYTITGITGKNPEWVAYIKAPTVVILVSVSVKDIKNFQMGKALLEDLVGSITWLADSMQYTP